MLPRYIVVLLAWLLCHAQSHPLNTNPKEQEDSAAEKADADKLPSHLLQVEHKKEQDDALGYIIKRVLASRTANAVDGVVSSVIGVAGGVVDDLGDIVVETIDQLPDTIRSVSDVVGKAVDSNREKVLIMVRNVRMDDSDKSKRASEQPNVFTEVIANSSLKSTLDKLEAAVGSLVGKFIGVTYKNAEGINSAISEGIRRITGQQKPLKEGEKLAAQSNSKIVKFLETDLLPSDEQIVVFIEDEAKESKATQENGSAEKKVKQ